MGTTAVFAVPLGVTALAMGDTSFSNVSYVGWVAAIYTGVVCSTVAYTLWIRGLRGVTATVSAILLLVMVIVAAVMDYVFRGTEMGMIAWAGAGILLVAMVLVNLEGTNGSSLGFLLLARPHKYCSSCDDYDYDEDYQKGHPGGEAR